MAARKGSALTLQKFMIYRSKFLLKTEKKSFLKLHQEDLESPKELNSFGYLRLVFLI